MRLIYPENRTITEREVIAWARDRMIDNAINSERAERGVPLDDETVDRIANDVPVPTLEDAIERLSDDGVATFRRDRQ